MLVFNIPTSGTTFDQYVMNTNTGAWCRFTNQNGMCWAIYNDHIYFAGASGKVYKADSVYNDDGASIDGDVESAFTYLGARNKIKRITAIRPLFRTATSTVPVALTMNTDFKQKTVLSSVPVAGTGGGVWDVAVWDVDVWGDTLDARAIWKVVNGTGYAASLRVKVSTQQPLNWMDITYVYETGGIL